MSSCKQDLHFAVFVVFVCDGYFGVVVVVLLLLLCLLLLLLLFRLVGG